MNKRRSFSALELLPRGQVPAYTVCAALFALGVVSGTFLSSGFAGSGGAAAYMSGYMASLAGVPEAGTLRLFWQLFRYPLLVFLLGFSVLGAVGIPALSFGRGFAMAFALSVLTRLYGGNGALMGVLLFGAVSALSVPAFLLVAAGAFLTSVRLGRCWLSMPAPAEPGNGPRAYLARFLLAAVFLLLLAIGERAAFRSGLLSLPIFS